MRYKDNFNANRIIVEEYQSPYGVMRLGAIGGSLCLCDWASESRDRKIDRRLGKYLCGISEGDDALVIDEARRQLDEYFIGKRREFSVPLRFAGSDFQIKVWSALLEIPYGETLSYGELAARVGGRSAVRAIANACGANAMSIFVPCHRVIGSNGAITGYAGGVDVKRALLRMEAGL